MEEDQRAGWQRAHGYVFEVAADAEVQAEARPLRAMGRFVHEAVAVEARHGHRHANSLRITIGVRSRTTVGFPEDSEGPREEGDKTMGQMNVTVGSLLELRGTRSPTAA